MKIYRPTEHCGLFGIWGPGQSVANLTYVGLYALQHRGQESAGIAVSGGSGIQTHKGMGLVPEVFDQPALQRLEGKVAIGHVRYSTSGESRLENAQPLVIRYRGGGLAIAHNGNLTNASILRAHLEDGGSIFQTTSDTEVIVHLIVKSRTNGIEGAIVKALERVEGAYSLLIMTEDRLIGVRDPFGIRPLCLGELGGGWVLASESCALDAVGARFVRDVLPGEGVIVGPEGVTSFRLDSGGPRQGARPAFCIFEYIYFARPDSQLEGRSVQLVRERLGEALAREHPARADLVIPVPDSGTSAAIGYARQAGIPFGEGLIKNRYVGRTFIQPGQEMRELKVQLKLNPVRHVLEGRRVVLIDDSIVRGTTSNKIVRMLRQAGAQEVHLRISSPPIRYSCYLGIDTPSEEELIGSHHRVEEIRKLIGADSLAYLTVAGMIEATAGRAGEFCLGCFGGQYPMRLAAGAGHGAGFEPYTRTDPGTGADPGMGTNPGSGADPGDGGIGAGPDGVDSGAAANSDAAANSGVDVRTPAVAAVKF